MKKVYVRIHPMAHKKFETNYFWDPTTDWNRSRKIVGNQVRQLELTKRVNEHIEGGGLKRSSKNEFSRYWNREEVKEQERNYHVGRILSVLGETASKEFSTTLQSEFSTTLQSEFDTYFDEVNHEIADQNEEKITLLNLILNRISKRERGGIKTHSLEKSFLKRQELILKGRREISLEQLFLDPTKLQLVMELLGKRETVLLQKRSDGSFKRGDKSMLAVFANELEKKGYLKKRIHGINVNSRIKAEAFGAYFGISISQRMFDRSHLLTLKRAKYHDKFKFISEYSPYSSNR